MILSLALLHVLVISTTLANYWSNWSRWSECSRTCDGGATYQTRKCIRHKFYKFGCDGESIRYSTCNNKPCPTGAPDFRAEQCAAYNDARYSGRYYRWLPYHDPASQCSLSCIAEGTKMVAILAPKVLDGTRCDTHTLDMCINGKCWNVGCDHVLNSKRQLDRCGICGGNDTCISINQPKPGRYRWIEIGFGPCSVTCGVGYQEPRLLCFDNYLGKVMDSSMCENLIKPSGSRRTCKMGSCPPEWRVGPWQNCTRECGGGVSWRIVTCVKTFDDGTQQWVRDSFCSKVKPSARKSCNNHICPTWHAGQWSVCSVSCGSGYQKREVLCRHSGDVYCDKTSRPRTMKNCTTGIPCYSLNDRRYAERGRKGDVQERQVGEFRASSGQTFLLEGKFSNEEMRSPRFVVSGWGPCSSSCGEGERFRYVRCQVYLQFLDDIHDLPDSDCEDPKPAETEVCYSEPCYDNYMWTPVGMTQCSHSCLGGVQETILKCTYKLNGTIVGDEYCVEAPHVPKERTICNDKACPQEWRVSLYGLCSASCGGGVQRREVDCIQVFAQGPDDFLTLPEFMCSQPPPSKEAPCNNIDCPANWAIGDWSECSVTCGTGSQVRELYCKRISGQGRLTNVSSLQCDQEQRPETDKLCNRTACPNPLIKLTDVKFFQLETIPKVRLMIGMEAAILPGTSVVVKCPTVGMDQEDVLWFKDDVRVRRQKRVKISNTGALRIRQSRPDKDSGIYTCSVGSFEGNISLTFSNTFDVLQASVEKDTFLKSADRELFLNGSILHTDPFDRQPKPFHIVPTLWSPCSVSCGGGLRSRNLSCEIITSNYFEVFPLSACTKHMAQKPLMISSCNTNPCVRWQTGNWTECLETECVRNMFAVQRRPVECTLEFNATVVDDEYCDIIGFPPDNIRDCFNRNCTAVWNTSKWSECMAECGKKGYKSRMLNCIWSNTGQKAQMGSCDNIEKPKTQRKCRAKPCSMMKCLDESGFCSTVKLMNMCRLYTFKKRCCATCSEDNNIDDEGKKIV